MERYNVYRIETNGTDRLFDSHVVAVKQTYTSKFADDMKEINKTYSPFHLKCSYWKNATKEEICSHYDNVKFIGESDEK